MKKLTKEEIVNHLRHHFKELDNKYNGTPNADWVSSFINLLKITELKFNLKIPPRKLLEKLYKHSVKYKIENEKEFRDIYEKEMK